MGLPSTFPFRVVEEHLPFLLEVAEVLLVRPYPLEVVEVRLARRSQWAVVVVRLVLP